MIEPDATSVAHIVSLTLESKDSEENCSDDSDDNSDSDSDVTVNKYEHSILYKIRHKTEEIKDCYAGSTTNRFEVRQSQHKCDVSSPHSKHYKLHVYDFIRTHGGWDEWIMELIEVYPCQNKKELLMREGHWVKTLGATLNSHMPGRTPEEYYRDNKERISARHKAWNDENKEHVAAQKLVYREATKDRRAEWQAKYDKDNKETRYAKEKARREANKEIITAKNTTRVLCECGATINHSSTRAHRRSQRHITYISGLQPVVTAVTQA